MPRLSVFGSAALILIVGSCVPPGDGAPAASLSAERGDDYYDRLNERTEKQEYLQERQAKKEKEKNKERAEIREDYIQCAKEIRIAKMIRDDWFHQIGLRFSTGHYWEDEEFAKMIRNDSLPHNDNISHPWKKRKEHWKGKEYRFEDLPAEYFAHRWPLECITSGSPVLVKELCPSVHKDCKKKGYIGAS